MQAHQSRFIADAVCGYCGFGVVFDLYRGRVYTFARHSDRSSYIVGVRISDACRGIDVAQEAAARRAAVMRHERAII